MVIIGNDKVYLMTKVAVLGSTGMLGSTLTRILENQIETIYEFNRSGISVTGNNEAKAIEVTSSDNILDSFKGLEFDYIVNCIGMIKHLINESDQSSFNLARKINSEFPSILNTYASRLDIPVIQVGTDCVYSGKSGLYSESDSHDPVDIYGETKNAGEQSATDSMIIRCSIVGKELKNNNSLLEWVISQPKGAKVKGYINHLWNGVTTLHFSQIISGIIKSGTYKPGIIHLVPKDIVSKYELINLISSHFGRTDLQVSQFEAETPINRSLITINPDQNLQLWSNGGYSETPTIAEMVSTYAKWTQVK
jgi:dTDP-4-dehydrorhamnose reductase